MDFSAFLDERQLPLLRFAIVLCGGRPAGEDVLQEVLLRAHQQWTRIGALDSPYGYVRTMVVNEHLAWRRKSARQIPTATADPGVTGDHADDVVDRDDLLRRVDALPNRQRAAVVMRYYADLDDAEIARTLGCEPATIRSYLSRGLAALRIDLADPERTAARASGEDH